MAEKSMDGQKSKRKVGSVIGRGKSQTLRRLEYLNKRNKFDDGYLIACELKNDENADRNTLLAIYNCEIGSSHFLDARDTALRCLALTEEPTEQGIDSNNIAWAGVLSFTVKRNAEVADEADNYSRAALLVAPEDASFSCTRALALVYVGKPEDGMDLAAECLKLRLSKTDMATASCALALARAQCGQQAEAMKLIVAAQYLDPKNLLLKTITSPKHD